MSLAVGSLDLTEIVQRVRLQISLDASAEKAPLAYCAKDFYGPISSLEAFPGKAYNRKWQVASNFAPFGGFASLSVYNTRLAALPKRTSQRPGGGRHCDPKQTFGTSVAFGDVQSILRYPVVSRGMASAADW